MMIRNPPRSLPPGGSIAVASALPSLSRNVRKSGISRFAWASKSMSRSIALGRSGRRRSPISESLLFVSSRNGRRRTRIRSSDGAVCDADAQGREGRRTGTVCGCAVSVLQEAGAVRECEEHGWMRDRADPYAGERAFDIARLGWIHRRAPLRTSPEQK